MDHDPTTIKGYTEWSLLGACRNHAEVDWYVEGMHSEAVHMRAEAIRICQEECPVRAQCLEWALLREPAGVWGGEYQRRIKTIRRARRIVMQIPGSFILDARRVYYAEGVGTLPSYLEAHTSHHHTIRGEAV